MRQATTRFLVETIEKCRAANAHKRWPTSGPLLLTMYSRAHRQDKKAPQTRVSVNKSERRRENKPHTCVCATHKKNSAHNKCVVYFPVPLSYLCSSLPCVRPGECRPDACETK